MAEGIELAVAYVSIVPSARGLRENIGRELTPAARMASKSGTAAGSSFVSGMGKQLRGMAGILGIALGGAALVRFFTGAVEAAEAFRRKQLLVAQAVRSTGGAANVSASDVDTLSTHLGKLAGVTRGTVLSVASMLLRFQAIRNVGPDKIFDRTAAAVLDVAAATGRDGVTGARMLGKALSDPIGGLGALSRSGVVFTTQQKEQIKALAESGRSLDAQKLILSGVEAKYKGAAAAVATPAQRMKVAWLGVKTTIGDALLPSLDSIMTGITNNVLPALKQIPDFVRAHWSLIRPIVDSIVGGFRSLWTTIVNLWHALQPAATLLAGAFIGALRLVAGAAKVAADALKYVTGVLSGQRGIVSSVALSILAMWAAFKVYGIAKVAISAITTQVGLLSTRIGLAKLAVGGFSLIAIAALAAVAIAVGVGVWLWQRHANAVAKAKAETEKQDAAIRDLTGAIKEDNGALGEHTRLMAAKQLQDSGALGAARNLKISTYDLTSAALGNFDAWNRVQTAMAAFQGTGADNEAQVRLINDALQATGLNLDSAKYGYDELGGAVAGTTTNLDGSTRAMQTQEQAAQTLKTALDELSGKAITDAQSELSLQSGLQSMTESLKDNGKSLTAHDKKTGMFTKGALANRQALLGLITTTNEHAQAVQDRGGDVVASLTKDEDMIKRVAHAAGLSDKEVASMLAQFAAKPADLKLAITADDSAAVATAKGLPAKVAALPKPLVPIDASMTPAERTAASFINSFGPDLGGEWGPPPQIPVKANTVPASLDIQNWINGQQPGITLPLHFNVDPLHVRARGGQLGAGWNLVGEQGPELISPTGMVHTASQSSRMLNGSQSKAMRVRGGRVALSADAQGNLSAWVHDLVVDEDQFSGSISRMGG